MKISDKDLMRFLSVGNGPPSRSTILSYNPIITKNLYSIEESTEKIWAFFQDIININTITAIKDKWERKK